MNRVNKAEENTNSIRLNGPSADLVAYMIMGAVVILVCFIRLRLLGVPLERDEGEYAYMGQLLLQGILPYVEAYNMKLPGIYVVYALIMAVFGQTHAGIHLALLFANIATAILLFLIGRRLFGTIAGAGSAVGFSVLTLSPTMQGFWANSEHFVILLAVGGLLLMLIAIERDSHILLLLSGLLLGSSFLMKQHGVFFPLFGFVYISYACSRRYSLLSKRFLSRLGVFSGGVSVPLSGVFLVFLGAGILDQFWFWTFKYASEYVAMVPLERGAVYFKMTFARIFSANASIFIVALLGALSMIWSRTARSGWFFAFGFLLASFAALCPGFYFRPHYFILWMPAVSLFAGMAAFAIIERLSTRALTLVLGSAITVALVFPVHGQRQFLFALTPNEACRQTYGLNPFPESIEVARYVRNNTTENDSIAILGSEPQICFYARRRSATGFLYTYALMEPQAFALQMQEKMIEEIRSSDPKYVVLVNVSTSWLMRPDSKKLLFEWFPGFLRQRYHLAGIVDLVSRDSTVYKWDAEVMNYKPQSRFGLLIFRQKSS
jgi:hypothetical protein